MSKETLKNIYFIIIGIAITEALNRTIVMTNDLLTSVLSLIIYLPTIIRFTHGASLYLDKIYEKRRNIAINFISFSFQSIIFYIMSLYLEESLIFLFLLLVMLFNDAFWILILVFKKYEEFDKTLKQWLRSDTVFALFIILSLIFLAINLFFKYIGLILVLIYAIFATFWDYIRNREKYFPLQKPKS